MAIILNSVNGFFTVAGGGTSPRMDTLSGAASVVALVIAAGSDPTSWINDSNNNVWIGPYAHSGSGQLWFYFTAGHCRTSSTHTFTVAQSGQPISFVAIALKDCEAPPDQQNTHVVSGTTAIQPGAITPSAEYSFMLTAVVTTSAAHTFAISGTFGIIGFQDYTSGVALTQLFTDHFTPNANPLNPANWATGTDAANYDPCQAVSGTARSTVTTKPFCLSLFIGGTVPADQYAQFTLQTLVPLSGAEAGIGILNDPTGDGGYSIFISDNGDGTQSITVLSGLTELYQQTGPSQAVVGDVFTIAKASGTLYAFQNSVLVFFGADATYTSGKPFMQFLGGSTTSDVAVSNFATGSAATGGSSINGLAVAGLETPTGLPTENPTWTFGSAVFVYAGILDLISIVNLIPPLTGDLARPAGPSSSGYGYQPLIFGNISAGSFSISGNCGAPGALVMFTGPSSGAVTADGSGNYSTPALLAGNYVITPSLAGWAFAPPSQAVTVSGFNVVGINFTATYTGAIFSISGNAGLAGATINWTGTASGSTTADPSGNYTIPFLTPGSYTVTPSGTGYTFAPASTVVPVSSGNVTGINFVATAIVVGHSISGNVGVAEATVNWSGSSGSGGVTADSSGNYIIPGFADGNYTITPRISGWSFTPTSRGVTVAGANVTGVNFSAVNLFQLPVSRDPTAAPAPGQIIPLTVSANQTFSVNLNVDGNALTLNLALRFNTMAGYWVLSIYDQGGNIILDALPMVTGWYPAGNILGQYGYLKIGSAYLLNEGTSSSDYPGTTDLGTGFQLLWGDTAP